MSAAGGLPDSGGSLLRAIIDALPELVFVLDREGTYVAVLGGRDDARYHDAGGAAAARGATARARAARPTDELTGLLNRRSFFELAGREA